MAVIHRGYRFRLYATAEQEAEFERFAGVCRFVYNLALEQRDVWWRQAKANGVRLGFFQQAGELTQLRAEADWIRDVPQSCEEAALRRLDAAFQKFFTGKGSYPRFQSKHTHNTFAFRGRDVSARRVSDRWSEVRLPKIGWARYRDTRPVTGTVKTVTVTKDALGWHVSFAVEAEAQPAISGLPVVGVDRGVANTLALSTGEMLSLPASMATVDGQYRKAQKAMARRDRGSARYARARRRCAVLAARRARIRRNWQHEVTSAIARRFGTVVLEDLNVASMTAGGRGKRGLNRSILNQGWSDVARMLDYKLAAAGGTLVLVNPAYTSQTCSSCGTVDRESRKSQAAFHCQHCGFRAHADTNAAINILRRNTASMDVEGSHFEPRESSTSALAA